VTDAVPTTPLSIWIAYNDACNAGDHQRAARWVAPDLTVLANGRPAVTSAQEDRAIQDELIRCYPDYVRQYNGGFEHRDWAGAEWTMRGTPAGKLDLPPLQVSGCSIIRCRDDRIVEARLYYPTGALDGVADRALRGG
jgi:hypothetical protein